MMAAPCFPACIKARANSWRLALLVAGVLLANLPTAAQAQIDPFRGYSGPRLSRADLDSGQAAASKLLHEDKAVVGQSEDWSGPTGNAGSIKVQKAFRRRGMDCRSLRSEIRYKDRQGRPTLLNLDVCQVKNGDWKLM